ncbi:MAG TPA: FAD-dependent oxidoreductase [Labilithrix sp.]|nr:FAD-dependent oxidoreductase [Labilithrix sp.]
MHQKSTGRRTAFVLGSGIAGLSLAEILSRNGWKITLLDNVMELGGDASRSTQNWLHTGWLYAGLPSASAMQGCATSLQLFAKTYGSVLPPDVVNVVADDTGVKYPSSRSGWFSAERVHYAFALSSYDLSPLQRLGWKHYLDAVILGRLRRLGYATEPVRDLPEGLIRLMNHWEGDENGHTKYRLIRSTDARIDTKRVLSSLLRMLGEDADVVLGADCELVRNGNRTAVRVNGELHAPDLCVVAAGKSIPRLLAQIGANEIADDFKSISSPIVVLRRALDLPNFIRFTPNLPETINHIKFDTGGVDVSTIGSYDFHPADQKPDISPFVEKVCKRLAVSPSEVVGSYYGTKTELTGKLARRYNHAVDAVNDNTFFAIAGKFSQFPLLVNEFAGRLGLSVDIANDARGTLAMEIAENAPERLVHAAGIGLERGEGRAA